MDAEIGIIGGSGFYSLLSDAEKKAIDTKYGKPSSEISIGKIGNKKVAFIARHGEKHTIPPHKVPYRANIEALSSLGVKRIIASSAVGSLKKEYAPGDFVFFDQYVNWTHGRADTFYDENVVAHVSNAYPYCGELRKQAEAAAKEAKIKYHNKGTIVIINGPRFSSRAESQFFSAQGFHAIGMTQYPEVALAREKAICYLGIGIVTDYDSGLEGRDDIKPVEFSEILSTFAKNVDKAKELVTRMVPSVSSERRCDCSKALGGAFHSGK